MALPQSWNKLILKFGENINKTPEKQDLENEIARPGSPFIMLLSEGEEEFNFHPNPTSPSRTRKGDDLVPDDKFDHDSMGSSLRLDSSCGNTSAEGENMEYESSEVVSDDTFDGLQENLREVRNGHVFGDDSGIIDNHKSSSDSEEVAMKENDELRSYRDSPMTKTQFENLFDTSGRLVREHELRRAIFKGGVDESIRKDVWQFLFELYPFNTTSREREVLKVELTLRYESMKIRWKKLLKTLVNEYEGVRYCPKWYSACPENANEHVESLAKSKAAVSVSVVEESSLIVDNVKAEELKMRMMIPKDIPTEEADKIDTPDFELKPFGLVCRENEEDEFEHAVPTKFTPSNYEEKLSQIHQLSKQRGRSDAAVTVEMTSIFNPVSHQNSYSTNYEEITNTMEYESHNSNSSNLENEDIKVNRGHSLNNTEKERATSINFECGEIDSISEALADAMLDADGTKTSTRNEDLSPAIDNATSPHIREEFDILDPNIVRKAEYDDKVNNLPENMFKPIVCRTISRESEEDGEESSEEHVIFPNPFTLPPEYVNNQESLYSQSENFQSLDIANLKTLNDISVKNNDPCHETAAITKNFNPSQGDVELCDNDSSNIVIDNSNFHMSFDRIETSTCTVVKNATQVILDTDSNHANCLNSADEKNLNYINSSQSIPPVSPAVHISSNDESVPPLSPAVHIFSNNESVPPISPAVHVSSNNESVPPTSPAVHVSSNDESVPPISPAVHISSNNESVPPTSPAVHVSSNDESVPPISPAVHISSNNQSVPPISPAVHVSSNDQSVPPISPAVHVSSNNESVPPISPAVHVSSNNESIHHCDDKCVSAEVENVKFQMSVNNYASQKHNKPLDISLSSFNSLHNDSPEHMWTPIKKLSVGENRIPASRSPTGESVEHLPPWIAQMINASTPSSADKTTPKSRTRTNSTPSSISLTKTPRRSVDSAMSPILSDSQYDKELLGIVENANKYLKQQAKAHSGRSTPKNDGRQKKQPTDTLKKSLAKSQSSPTVRPASCHDMDSFMDVSTKFVFVKNSHDVDGSSGMINQQDTDKEDGTDAVFPVCPYCNFNQKEALQIMLQTSLGEEQLKSMAIQAQVYAARQNYNDKLISSSIRVIDKDVPRTDRELPQFKGDDNPGLIKLRDSLLTYAFFHPEVGYAQGMNDIMSRFLVVMDTEAEAFWMFVNYMEHFKNDFMEEGMLQKIALVEQLLMKMDRELYDYLQNTDMGLMFCHRWLLLNFKREFDYSEAIRLFEITSSRHLEVSSVEAELERSKERAKEFVKDNAGSHLEEIYLSPEYPFDIFVCVAMLMECRHMIMDTLDLTAVYQILSNLPTTMDLTNILRKSEELFYRYCRKTVVDCFQVIDELEVQDFHRKKKPFSFAFR